MKTCYKSKEKKGPSSSDREMGDEEDISSFPKPKGVYSKYGKIWSYFLHLQNQLHFLLSSCLLSTGCCIGNSELLISSVEIPPAIR